MHIVTHMHPLQVVVPLCTLLYSTVQGTGVQYLFFKSRVSRSKCKSSGDVVGPAKRCQELVMRRKDEERQEGEEATADRKRFTTQEVAGGFSLFEEALLVSEAQDPKVGWYTKVAAVIQNAMCHL